MTARCGAVGCWALLCVAWAAPTCAAGEFAGLLACRAFADPAARLECFDREAAALDAKASTASDARASTVPIPRAPPPDSKQKFGLPEAAIAKQEVAAGVRAANASKIEAHLLRFSQAANGRAVFTLDNDQTWTQLAAGGEMLVRPGDAVTVSRGALGSYWLETPSGRGCKVTRLR